MFKHVIALSKAISQNVYSIQHFSKSKTPVRIFERPWKSVFSALFDLIIRYCLSYLGSRHFRLKY